MCENVKNVRGAVSMLKFTIISSSFSNFPFKISFLDEGFLVRQK